MSGEWFAAGERRRAACLARSAAAVSRSRLTICWSDGPSPARHRPAGLSCASTTRAPGKPSARSVRSRRVCATSADLPTRRLGDLMTNACKCAEESPPRSGGEISRVSMMSRSPTLPHIAANVRPMFAAVHRMQRAGISCAAAGGQRGSRGSFGRGLRLPPGATGRLHGLPHHLGKRRRVVAAPLVHALDEPGRGAFARLREGKAR